MRLKRVESGHRLLQLLTLKLISLLGRQRAPDVLRVMLYRPEYFGAEFARQLHGAMRGPSEWSVGERELMAAVVSRENRCRF